MVMSLSTPSPVGPTRIILLDATALVSDDWSTVDRRRSDLAHRGVVVFVVTDVGFEALMRHAPNLASWLAGEVFAMVREDDEDTTELGAQRLAALRVWGGYSDEEIVAKAAAGSLPPDPEYGRVAHPSRPRRPPAAGNAMSWRDVEAHTQSRQLVLPSSARDLTRALRALLVDAHHTGELSSAPKEIHATVKMISKPPPSLADHLKARNLHQGACCIEGGDPSRPRDPAGKHLVRSDGAWFDFSITVREGGPQVEVLTYRFEIRFAPGIGAPFMRFDRNLPEVSAGTLANEPRSHLHPGHDDLRVSDPADEPRRGHAAPPV